MAGIVLNQPNGVGVLNDAGAQHPAPVEIDVGEICQLSFSGSTRIYRWVLSKPSESASVLSSGNSAGPSFMPDVDGGSYSISLIDANEVEYILDIVTPTTGGGGGGGGGTSVSVAIEDYAAVRASSFAGGLPPATFVVLRRESVGDGGEGTFVFLEGDSTSDDNDGTVLVDSDGNRYQRVFSGAADVRWFGVVAYPSLAAASAGTDSHVALQAAIRAIASAADVEAHRVALPYGFIRCGDTLEISGPVHIKGHGKANTVLVFPGTSTGIEVNHSYTSSDGGDGSLATLEDFQVYAASTAGNVDGVAIHANAVTCNRIRSAFWGRWGFHISASITDLSGNANDWRMFDCISAFTGQAGSGEDRGGMYVHGNDSSAGKCFGFQALEITGIAVREESFLGNYYEGCHVEVASAGSYNTRPAQVSRSTFVSCYVEAAPAAKIYYPNCWLGGYPVSGFSSDSDGLIIPDSAAVWPFEVPNKESGNDAADLVVGDYSNALGSGAKKALIGWRAPNASDSGYTEDYSLFWDYTNKLWSLRRHADDNDTVLSITAWGNEREHSQLKISNLIVGASGVRVTSGAAVPVSGIWYLGDRHIHSDPTVGAPVEWVCTTRGGFGVARANNHAYTRYEIITVSGRVYECINESGVSAGSPPSFNFSSPDDETTDGTVTWRFHGTDPPVFDPVYASSLGAFTRVVRGQPWFSNATEWTLDQDGHATTTVDTETYAYFQLEVPNGATISVVSMTLDPAAHGTLPANMPQISLRSVLYDGTVSVSGPATDASATSGDYAGYHVVELSGLSVVVNNVDNRYIIKIRSEYGANAASGMKIMDVYATITPAAPDRGAA